MMWTKNIGIGAAPQGYLGPSEGDPTLDSGARNRIGAGLRALYELQNNSPLPESLRELAERLASPGTRPEET
ncbi:MAG TPA: hypothetical protein VIL65_06860 [Beijerinckiaceae bacterium]|jgi:hypothetical protein